MTSLRKAYHARPLNCGPMKPGERCQRCGQMHLTPGYCQALDPESLWHRSALGIKWKAAHPNWETVQFPERLPGYGVSATPSSAVTPSHSVTKPLSVTVATAKTCEVCGKKFVPHRATAHFCSPGCRVKAHRERGDGE